MTTFPQAMVPPFPAGYGPLPADMTAWVRNNFGFITTNTVFRAEQHAAAGQALSSATFDALQLDTILEDPYSGWAGSGGGTAQPAWSWLAPYTGWYEVSVTVPITAGAIWLSAAITISIGMGGVTQWLDSILTPSATGGACSGAIVVPCAGGIDYIQAGTAVSANATTDTSGAARYPSVEITYISGG